MQMGLTTQERQNWVKRNDDDDDDDDSDDDARFF